MRFAAALPRTIFAIPLLAVALHAQAQPEARGPDTSLPGAWLKNVSSWQQHVRHAEGSAVDKRKRGVFPIGNGRVFGYCGLGRRANTMQGLTGPHYQTQEVNAPKGHWGELSFDVLSGGDSLPQPIQRVWRTRGVNCVITEDASHEGKQRVALTTINVAMPEQSSLLRIVEVANHGSTQSAPLTLRATWERGKAKGAILVADYAAKGYAAELSCSLGAKSGASASGGTLAVELGSIAAGARKQIVFLLRTGTKGKAFDEISAAGLDLAQVLESVARHWDERLKGSTVTACSNRKLSDLLEDWKILMLVQRCGHSGAVSPMVNYRGSWVRDNNGPILAFLRYGMHTEARTILDYVYDATVVTGRLNNHVPLDLDVSKAREREKNINWERLQIPNTELPGWIILQHEWYYRATWDIAYIQERWPFLSACYQAMRPDDRATLATHGDETYLGGALFSLFPDKIGANGHLPADSGARRLRSFDSSLIYLLSINAMGELIEDVEKRLAGDAAKKENWQSQRKQSYDNYHVEYLLKLEETFWMPKEKRFAAFISPVNGKPHSAPFAPVNLRPQWIGYTYAIGEKNKENLSNTLAALWQKDGRVGVTPNSGYAVGHQQGYLLYALADLEDKRRDDAMRALINLAGPAGEWGELYDPEGLPIAAYNKDWPNRLRPWESGVNIDAIYFALTGIRFVCSPGWSKEDQRLKLRMAPDANWLSIRGIEHDGHRSDIHLDRVFSPPPDKPGMKPESRLRFRIEYSRINRDAANIDYVDAAISVGDTMYVRYPTIDAPVHEHASWPNDTTSLFPKHEGPGKFEPSVDTPHSSNSLLFVTGLPRVEVPTGSAVLDFGLPLEPKQFGGLLLAGDKPRYESLLLHWDVGGKRRSTMKGDAWWKDPAVVSALAAYEKAGGKVLRAKFVDKWRILGPIAGSVDQLDKATPAEDAKAIGAKSVTIAGRSLQWKAVGGEHLDLARSLGPDTAKQDAYFAYAAINVESASEQEAVLKLGSTGSIRLWVNDRVESRKASPRALVPDVDTFLVRLKKGSNRVLIKIAGRRRACGLYVRWTDVEGMPLSGIEIK